MLKMSRSRPADIVQLHTKTAARTVNRWPYEQARSGDGEAEAADLRAWLGNSAILAESARIQIVGALFACV